MRASRYLPEAEAELVAQFEFYRERSERKASGFLAAVDIALDHACDFPAAAPLLARGYRARVLGRPFMYRLVYRIEDDVLVVAAIWSDRRDPGELMARLRTLPGEPDE